jgi:hypothetical protein
MKVADKGSQVFFGRNNEPGPTLAADDAPDEEESHFANFIECIRSRKTDALAAPLEEGHHSTALCHLGNISYRVGRSLTFDGEHERFDDDDAQALVGRTYRAPYTLPEIS